MTNLTIIEGAVTSSGSNDRHLVASKSGDTTVLSAVETVHDGTKLRRLTIPAFIFSGDGLRISQDLINYLRLPNPATYVMNGVSISEYADKLTTVATDGSTLPGVFLTKPLEGWRSVKSFHIQRFPPEPVDRCRLYTERETDDYTYDKPSSVWREKDNGITVAPSRAFNTFTLRQMLANTSNQLASISGFNQASISASLGNLQGISRDTSFLSGQVTTNATPTVSNTAVNGTTGSDTIANNAGSNSTYTAGNTGILCPPGFNPTVVASSTGSGIPACAPVQSGVLIPGSILQNSQQLTLNPTQSTSNTNVLGNTQQNTLTTTSGGFAGAVAPVPASTALAPPTNVGVSSSDILAEQVQLNSQITTLQLLLQGALSDQYLVKGGRAVATRQQTTVGFSVSLNPPQRYKHAVAEVRVWVEASKDNRVGVINLLPADKTYNVAKITSRQNAFGAGAVVEALNIGLSTGKSKDRLYIAKDTDTVALQYKVDKPRTSTGADRVGRSVQVGLGDAARTTAIWQQLSDTCADDPSEQSDSLVFGWQFRPVLGADYVQAGQRTVYAQLALPSGLGTQFTPRVYIQTRWREYDSKRQAVGAVYQGSCSVAEDQGTIAVISPLKVHETKVDDMGNGVLKVSARGDFFSNGLSVLSGSNTVLPTAFDGSGIQLLAKATDLLLTDDLRLMDEDRRPVPLGMGTPAGAACRIASAKLTALPRPDGNSMAELTVTTGDGFREGDGELRPLVLIGSQVYGLHETPFIDPQPNCVYASTGGATCTYHFLASTDVLRNAQTFTVRDLAWRNFKKTGTTDLGPVFSSLSVLGSSTGIPPAIYTLSGFHFEKFAGPGQRCGGAIVHNCVEAFQGIGRLNLNAPSFEVVSQTTATLELNPFYRDYEYKSLRFVWHGDGDEKVEWDVSIPENKKPTPTASAVLSVSDSRQITFSNVEMYGDKPTATFDNAPLLDGSYKYDRAKKELKVNITSAMTAKVGNKELTLTDSMLPPNATPTTQPKTLQLPFEVVKR